MFFENLIFLTATVADLAVPYTLCRRYTLCAHFIYQKNRILCWFKNVEKVAKKCTHKSYWKCDGKMYFFHFYSCSSNWFPYNFLCVHFFATFQSLWNQHEMLRFFNIFFDFFKLGAYQHFMPLFANFEVKSAQNGSKKGKTPFLNRC